LKREAKRNRRIWSEQLRNVYNVGERVIKTEGNRQNHFKWRIEESRAYIIPYHVSELGSSY
jgi:hypothetical protein